MLPIPQVSPKDASPLRAPIPLTTMRTHFFPLALALIAFAGLSATRPVAQISADSASLLGKRLINLGLSVPESRTSTSTGNAGDANGGSVTNTATGDDGTITNGGASCKLRSLYGKRGTREPHPGSSDRRDRRYLDLRHTFWRLRR